ncbi:MAG TPA: hypothetical protein VGL81_22605 [Polyangiaceae bacterium]|jgi:hypothetical protein
MRSVALALAVLLAGCAASPSPAIPPVAAIPIPPAAHARAIPAPAPPRAPRVSSPLPPPPAEQPWIERVERRESTKRVTDCQIVPFSVASLIVASFQPREGRTDVRFDEDEERATEVDALPSLLGKAYRVTTTAAHTLEVRDASDVAAPPEEAARVRALATASLGWPGQSVVGHPLARGAEAKVLEAPVAAIAAVPLHGSFMPEAQQKTVVRFRAARDTELVFDVTLQATESDSGMCHTWTSRADLKGELHLRARDGALLALHLEGTTGDTEGTCQKPDGTPGPPPPPHACNRGAVTIDVKQPDVR